MFNLRKQASGECGGFQKPKGHLDTQMYPECEGKPGDRDIQKKHRKKKTKKSFNLSDFYKEAKFGPYLDHPEYNPQAGKIVNPETGRPWIAFRDAKYSPANPPTPEEARAFVSWVDTIIDAGGLERLLSKPLRNDPSIINGFKRVRNMSNSMKEGVDENGRKTVAPIVRKAFDYASYFYQIEKHGWVDTKAYEGMAQRQKEQDSYYSTRKRLW